MPVINSKNPGDPWDAVDANNLRSAIIAEHKNTAGNEHADTINLGDGTTNTDRAVVAKRLGGVRTIRWTEAAGRWEIDNGTGFQALATLAGGTLSGDLDFAGFAAKNVRVDPRAVDPASPTEGQAWYNTVGKAARLRTAAGSATIQGRIFENTVSSAAITNTVAPTLFNQNASLPANSLTVGRRVKVHAWGVLASAGTPTLSLALSLGGSEIASSGAIVTRANAVNDAWEFDGEFLVRTVSGISTCVAIARATVQTGSMATLTGLGRSNGTAPFDAAVANVVGVSWTWSVAALGNSATLEGITIET